MRTGKTLGVIGALSQVLGVTKAHMPSMLNPSTMCHLARCLSDISPSSWIVWTGTAPRLLQALTVAASPPS